MGLKLLDLYCGAGGAARGYELAGFTDIVGVDKEPQPNYPYRFIQADALNSGIDLNRFDLIHASPPCQAFTSLQNSPNSNKNHPELVAATRELLDASDRPWVIENVYGAPLNFPTKLCGSSFHLGTGDLQLRRHRYFETRWLILSPHRCRHKGETVGVHGDSVRNTTRESKRFRVPKALRCPPPGGISIGISRGREAMEIGWMTMKELCQAVPPAYTEFIGREIIKQLRRLSSEVNGSSQE